MAIFSNIIKQQEDTRRVAQAMGEPLKMQITLASIKEDMERLAMLLPQTVTYDKEHLLLFTKEVEQFYNIVERLARSKNGLNADKQRELDFYFRRLRAIKNDLKERANNPSGKPSSSNPNSSSSAESV